MNTLALFVRHCRHDGTFSLFVRSTKRCKFPHVNPEDSSCISHLAEFSDASCDQNPLSTVSVRRRCFQAECVKVLTLTVLRSIQSIARCSTIM